MGGREGWGAQGPPTKGRSQHPEKEQRRETGTTTNPGQKSVPCAPGVLSTCRACQASSARAVRARRPQQVEIVSVFVRLHNRERAKSWGWSKLERNKTVWWGRDSDTSICKWAYGTEGRGPPGQPQALWSACGRTWAWQVPEAVPGPRLQPPWLPFCVPPASPPPPEPTAWRGAPIESPALCEPSRGGSQSCVQGLESGETGQRLGCPRGAGDPALAPGRPAVVERLPSA